MTKGKRKTDTQTDKEDRIQELEAEVSQLQVELIIQRRVYDNLYNLYKELLASFGEQKKPPNGHPTAENESAKVVPWGMQQLHGLTPKQHATLQMLMRGASNAEIAERLNVEESTAKVHVRALAKKFGVRRRSQIVLAAGQFANTSSDQLEALSKRPPRG